MHLTVNGTVYLLPQRGARRRLARLKRHLEGLHYVYAPSGRVVMAAVGVNGTSIQDGRGSGDLLRYAGKQLQTQRATRYGRSHTP